MEQQLSLENALKGAGVVFQGNMHRACDDGRNTAMLYHLTQEKDEFKVKMDWITELLEPTPTLTNQHGSFVYT